MAYIMYLGSFSSQYKNKSKKIFCTLLKIKFLTEPPLMIEISNSTQECSMQEINFDKLIPAGILFSIKEIDNMRLIKEDMLRKLIYNRGITVVKIGSKNFIARDTLIAYLEANTIPAIN